MKKIITLFSALLMSTMMFAQLSFVDANGKEIKDGSVITMNEAEMNDWDELQVALKGISIKNSSASNVDFTMTATSKNLPANTSFACCFGQSCQTLTKAGSLELKKLSIGANETAEIANTEWVVEENVYGTCTVDLKLMIGLTEGPKITVNFVYADPTAIKNTKADAAKKIVAVYSISGARIPSLQKGINIVKYSDGSVKKVIKK